jgi:hypothetical protein
MENKETNKRTRMNVSLTAKGLAQWDVTAEYDTPEQTDEALSKAIDLVRATIKSKGLTEVSA